ncbi:uncharacterized protein LOC100201069 isoform X2 [Hydra vulgaris]|uniref:Uncharacterized protein LOC100201069 isoform X2 n=1 Tax=Hydra vulgaris TaxID=6087 RepID=A0ABM4DJS2_HYDVU
MKCTSWLADFIKNSSEQPPEWLFINQFLEQSDNGILCEASDKTHQIKAFITNEAIQNFEKKRDLHVRHIKGGLILCQKFCFESLYPYSFNTLLKISCFDSPGGLSVAQIVDHLPLLETSKKSKLELCHKVCHQFLNKTSYNKNDWIIQDFEEKILKEKEGWVEKNSVFNNTWKDSWYATPLVEYPSSQQQVSLSPPSKKSKILSNENITLCAANQNHVCSSKLQAIDKFDQSLNISFTQQESENQESQENMFILEKDDLQLRSAFDEATVQCYNANSCESSLCSPGILNNTHTVIEPCSSGDQLVSKGSSPTYSGTTRNKNSKSKKINEMSYELLSSLLDLAVVDKPISISCRKPRAPKCIHKFIPTCSNCCYHFLYKAVSDF